MKRVDMNEKFNTKRLRTAFQTNPAVFKISSKVQQNENVQVNEEDDNSKRLIKNWGFPDQIVRYYRDKGINEFFPWQVEALEQPGVLEHYKNLVYSAPTSAGKTMVSDVLLYKNLLERKKKAIIILPFVSITVEKVETLKKMLRKIGIKIDKFAGNSNPKGGFALVDVAVCTIEKANNMINRLIEEDSLSDVGLVVVDELHMLGDSSRGYLLELLLTKILFHSKRAQGEDNLVQIVGMSATIPNLPDISRWLNAELYITEFRPVPLLERVVHVMGKDTPAFVVEYHKEKPDDDFASLSSVDTRDLGIKHDDAALIYTSIETVLDGFSALIFCPTKALCERLSREIAFNIFEFGAKKKLQNPRVKEIGEKIIEQITPSTEKIKKLIQSLQKSPAGLDPLLEESVKFGVAFHHAGLSNDERSAVEEGFRKGTIRILCSTTTLSAGVNLPARRVLISSPFNYRGTELMDVITYRQMIGRAGRKGIDELGEAYTFCQANDYEKAQALIRSDIKPIKSCLLRINGENSSVSSEDSNSSSEALTVVMSDNLKKAIIEIIANGTALNKCDIIEYCKCTFFNESFRTRLSEDQQESGAHFEAAIDQVFEYLSKYQLVYFNTNPDENQLELRISISNLGKAIVASGILPDEGQFIQKELDRARRNLSLVNDLHLVYQVTPTYISNQLDTIDWNHYWDLYQKLSPEEKEIGETIGIGTWYFIKRISSSINLSTARQREEYAIYKRFYASLALNDLIQEIPLSEVARKYRLVKGQVQSLQQQAATFAGMLATFCNKLGWNNMELLIEQFQPRLAFGVQRELLDLMRISFLPATVARSLFKHYLTLKDLIYEKVEDIERCIIQGIAFEKSEDNNPKSKAIFVPALEQHMTISELAAKILEESRELVQAEIGQIINFDLQASSNTQVTQNVKISPIKGKSAKSSVVEFKVSTASASTPLADRRLPLIRSASKHAASTSKALLNSSNIEQLFDDSLEFSFGATPNKQARLEASTSIRAKDKSSRKLDFDCVADDADSEDEKMRPSTSGSSKTFQDSRKKTQLLSEESSLFDDSFDDIYLKELTSSNVDKVKPSTSTTKPINDSPLTTNDPLTNSIPVLQTPPPTTPRLMTSNGSNKTNSGEPNLANPVVLDSLSRSESSRCLPSQDSGTGISATSQTDSNSSDDSFSFGDSEDYAQLIDQSDEIEVSRSELTIRSISSHSSSRSFMFADEFSQEELDQIVNPSQANNDENSCHSTDFFQTFTRQSINEMPLSFQSDNNVSLSEAKLIPVIDDDDLDALVQFMDTQPDLELVMHFVVRPLVEVQPIVQKPKSRRSIINFLEPKAATGLPVRDGIPLELAEMYVTKLGCSTVFCINSCAMFEQFRERFKATLSRIDSTFEDAHRSPSSTTSDLSDASKKIRILTYDVKLSLHLFVRAFKLPLDALMRKVDWFDLQVGIWLLDPEAESFNIDRFSIQNIVALSIEHSLEQSFIQAVRMYERSLNQDVPTASRKTSKYARKKKLDDTPEVNMLKTILCGHLMVQFSGKLIEQNLYRSYRLIEIPARLSFAAMEMRGIAVDEIRVDIEIERIRKFLSFLEHKIFKLVGEEFNLNSPDQVARVLFRDQGLLSNYFQVTRAAASAVSSSKKLPKVLSTNKDALIKLQEACGTKTRLPTLILEWRRLNHALHQSVLQIRHSLKDGLVYCQLEEWTATGRIAMHDPNLINVDKNFEISSISVDLEKKLLDADDSNFEDDDNVPKFNGSPTKIKSATSSQTSSRPIKVMLRDTIIARDGYCFVSADYRQLELRILAHFSKDADLLAALNDSDIDVFRSIAATLEKVAPENVSTQGRQHAKQICYGIIYGMGDTSLAEQLSVTIEEAIEFRVKFLNKYSKIHDFIEQTVENCERDGFVEMVSHRRRLLPHIHSEQSSIASKARRQAVNSVIQGSAADCIKMAMCAVDAAIRNAGFDASLVLQMHDELMYEVRDDSQLPDHLSPNMFAELLKHSMESVSQHLKVILPVKVQKGPCWGELNEFEFNV